MVHGPWPMAQTCPTWPELELELELELHLSMHANLTSSTAAYPHLHQATRQPRLEYPIAYSTLPCPTLPTLARTQTHTHTHTLTHTRTLTLSGHPRPPNHRRHGPLPPAPSRLLVLAQRVTRLAHQSLYLRRLSDPRHWTSPHTLPTHIICTKSSAVRTRSTRRRPFLRAHTRASHTSARRHLPARPTSRRRYLAPPQACPASGVCVACCVSPKLLWYPSARQARSY
ncbi:hypothetical protein T440DRAFT_93045 [Plenodomus tracheiphilus IPT5]|uniref:Uncharacterized protein n=1 Tax=Plenodomus tracheiphilus IPT5 TaxID=1408161 RepID=A0A6A7BK79_9PLEO|nr:hypothetical protein T440DRAFT_93045 [Plenodomus tracheiphilus IPT5]